MQYDVATPAEYLEVLEDDWRRDMLLELRDLILESGPQLAEGIEYKMLVYKDEAGESVIALNAQKHYVSLYVGTSSKVDPDGSLLDGLDCGKGCIRFKKTKKIAETRIDEFIRRALELHAEGVDISC